MCHTLVLITPFLSTLSLRRATRNIYNICRFQLFLSTLSLRRATSDPVTDKAWALISIHALLAESDRRPASAGQRLKNFYPRSPCGERLIVGFFFLVFVQFLSTLSLRRATTSPKSVIYLLDISIHALLAESDPVICFIVSVICLFLSTLSLRRATSRSPKLTPQSQTFLSTLSLRRATASGFFIGSRSQFLSTLSLRRATRSNGNSSDT